MKADKTEFRITDFSSFAEVDNQYSVDFIKAQKCVVVSCDEEKIVIAQSEKSSFSEDFFKKLHSPKKIEIMKVRDSDFAEFTGSFVEKSAGGTINQLTEKTDFSLEEISCDAPAVNIINAVCLEAIRKNSSDIHIQNTQKEIIVRLRIDGVLQKVKSFSPSVSSSLVNRIKIMSGLNVMENRLCQDGRMTVTSDGKNYDFRVSVIPCVKGQSIVLRLFNLKNKNLNLEELGFSKENYLKLKNSINYSGGMILATGPTGSGKTTTLHALLNEMDRQHLKIVTIEDPVEEEIEGVDQIQVNEEIGLSFENILRRILRQDPDVIMVGEIRDKETAELAVRSALTGHLILSTIHTNDSIGAVTRLKNLGIENYLIADILRLSLAQRLVRKICSECKGSGCRNCNNTGYKDRTAVSELFEADENVRSFIEEGKSESDLRKYLKTKGFKTLYEDAQNKVKLKLTTKEEILREGLYEN